MFKSIKNITGIKLLGAYLVTLALVTAAHFGYRCPAQGCPACRLIGQ